jgi:hypothetical protein
MIFDLPISEILIPMAVAAVCVVAIFTIRLRKPMKRWMRVGLYVVLAFTAVEFGVARNPIVIEQLWLKLTSEQIGVKQRELLRLEIARRETPWNQPYLVIGSSQVWAVFGKASVEREELTEIHSASMTVMELNSYRDTILRHGSGRLLLYVSELDLTRMPTISSLKLTPQMSAKSLWTISGLLHENDQASPSEIAELWISNYLSIYRFSFVADGLINKVADKIGGPGSSHSRSRDAGEADVVVDETQHYVDQIVGAISDKWFETNVQQYDDFFAWAKDQGIGITVVQGEYHPTAMEQLSELREQATQLISGLCDEHDHVQYVSSQQVRGFEASDYTDATHVTDESGAAFVDRLMQYLQEDR